jgi:PAS domain S-box-containing protein
MVAGTDDGVVVVDADRRFVYANPAACEMLGYSLEEVRGRDLLDSFPVGSHPTVRARLVEDLAAAPAGAEAFRDNLSGPFSCTLAGSERDVVCSTFAVDIDGTMHSGVMFRDLTGPQSTWRTAAALAQTAAQLVRTGTTEEILVGLARHAVEGTRAPAVGITVVGDDHKLVVAGGYGFPSAAKSRDAWTAGSITLGDLPSGDVLLSNQTVVLPDARPLFEASPVLRGFAAALEGMDWQGAIYVPLSWEDRVFGFFGVFLPPGVAGPNEGELAFYRALADQAAVVVTNARLAASLERTRLARELHDSVSQALFSMTMHARAAQLSMAKAGLDPTGPLGRSIAQLAELTRGALAEMRALIFELRPEALAEEGLVAALRKQGAALAAREQVAVMVDGPEESLELESTVEEHLYRIVSEALHNVVKHARADNAAVSVTSNEGVLRVAVSDDGAGFDSDAEHPGHLGLSTMAERARAIGADLTITSGPGAGTTVAVSLPRDRREQRKGPGGRGDR